ncbi:MAG: hypothetical protein QW343_02150 [Candidatus Norongarragalinales archaeon]
MNKNAALALLIAATITWASTFVLIKSVVAFIEPFALNAARFTVASSRSSLC